MATSEKHTTAQSSSYSINSHSPTSEYNSNKLGRSSHTFEAMDRMEQANSREDEKNGKVKNKLKQLYTRFTKSSLLIFWILFTGFLIASYVLQIPKGYDQELLILGLLYLYTSLFLLFCYVPTTVVTKPWNFTVHSISEFLCKRFSHRIRTIFWTSFVIAVIVATVFAFPEKEESPRIRRLISVFGFFIIIVCIYISSKHRSAIQWNTISTAIFMQFILALFVFQTSVGNDIFQWMATFAEGFLGYSWFGTSFVFGDTVANSGVVAVTIFPPIIFFAAVVQMLYYVGAIQFLLRKVSVACAALLKVTGAEAVVVVASPFLGASENALLIEPLLKDCTKSEIHQILTCGFATISGSTLYAYIEMGVSGKALLTSCIMSIPCSIAISKLRYPETEESVVKNVTVMPELSHEATNIVHAAVKGAKLGIEIVLLIMANLICILSILNAINGFLTWAGHFVTIQELTLQIITGYVFVPVAWLIGVDNKDLVVVGRLMAMKIWATEFVAYQALTTTYKGVLSARSELVATYALCGFANLGTVGTQVGVLSTLAPSRSGDISKLAISALICGSFSTWLSAAIAGMLV
ncbi:hypothetical protein G6F56_002465 [Rhizopus delemar]|nr:hypothetical protein G6F56_002465 [Rhizopus delemar]